MVRRTVFLVVAAAVLAACAFPVACAGSYAADERRSIATQIWEDIKLRYSYFHDKGMNWDEVGRVYIGAAEAAESDRQFFAAIAGMVRELRDGHSYVYEYPQPLGGSHGSPAVELALIEGRPVVVGVAEGSDAEGLGVAVGMEVLRVDGMDAGQLLWELEGGVTASTPWSARAIAARALLAGPLDQDVEVELGDGGGSVLRVRLARRSGTRRKVDPIGAAVLDGNIGYIRLASFSFGVLGLGSAKEFRKAFDAAMEVVRGCRALIIDVRGNGGGDDRLAGACAGRLLSEATDFPRFQFRVVTLGKGWFTPVFRRSVAPRGLWQFRGPMVLCIDEQVFSSAEHFVAGLHDSGRAVTVGQTTAGSSGNPVSREVAGFKYQISRWREYRTTGELIEGRGVPADVEVAPTLAGVLAGRDEVLEKAVEVAINMSEIYLR